MPRISMHVSVCFVVMLPLTALAQTRPTVPAPVPKTSFEGPALEFDFPGMLIGTAEYDEGPTGVTVFYFPNLVKGAVDARGGAPGTVNTDALRLGYNYREMSAVVFSGGSWHGLSAVTGAGDEIRSSTTNDSTPPQIKGVVGAIINDLGFGSGRRRFSSVTPDATLARRKSRCSQS